MGSNPRAYPLGISHPNIYLAKTPEIWGFLLTMGGIMIILFQYFLFPCAVACS